MDDRVVDERDWYEFELTISSKVKIIKGSWYTLGHAENCRCSHCEDRRGKKAREEAR